MACSFIRGHVLLLSIRNFAYCICFLANLTFNTFEFTAKNALERFPRSALHFLVDSFLQWMGNVTQCPCQGYVRTWILKSVVQVQILAEKQGWDGSCDAVVRVAALLKKTTDLVKLRKIMKSVNCIDCFYLVCNLQLIGKKKHISR